MAESDWIQLTGSSGETELWVRFTDVVGVVRIGGDDPGAYTQILLKGTQAVTVQEPPQAIFAAASGRRGR